MKILIVNKYLYPKGGSEVYAMQCAKILRDKGHDVFCWGMNHRIQDNSVPQEFLVNYIDYEKPAGFKRKISLASKLLYSFEAKRKIELLIEKEKPDIAHLNNFAHQISPSILHALNKHNIPTVMTLHDFKLVCPSYLMFCDSRPCQRCQAGRYYWCALKKCMKNSSLQSLLNTLEMYLHHKILKIYDLIDIFISPSMFLKEKLEEMGFLGEIICLPNFVNLSKFQPEFTGEQKTIVYFGRLSGEKGLFTLLSAVKGLDVKLKIIGDGSVREQLEKKAADENIDNVMFLGYRTGQDLNDQITKASAVVIPSQWYENNPITVIESFAFGKPVIGARIGGIPELVQDLKTGLTFESGNVEDLREKIKLITADSDRLSQMGRNARAHVEENNNSENYFQRIIEIYEKVINNKKPL